MSSEQENNPNIDREKERREAEALHPPKEKYTKGSHTANTNSEKSQEKYHDQKTAKDKDLQNSMAPLLDRKKAAEQRVDVKNKSSIEEKEG